MKRLKNMIKTITESTTRNMTKLNARKWPRRRTSLMFRCGFGQRSQVFTNHEVAMCLAFITLKPRVYTSPQCIMLTAQLLWNLVLVCRLSHSVAIPHPDNACVNKIPDAVLSWPDISKFTGTVSATATPRRQL